MNLEDFIKKYNGKPVDIDKEYWHQCVDLIKQFTIDCFWFSIWSFWWSAMTGWKNTVDTFPKAKFEKITDLSKLLPWDIVFTTWNPKDSYWHVMIMTKNLWNWKIEVIEQNMWNWNWEGSDDFVKVSVYTLSSKILWAYRFKEKMSQEMEEKLSKAQELWIWNWKDWDKPATRAEVAIMCLRIYDLICEKIEK